MLDATCYHCRCRATSSVDFNDKTFIHNMCLVHQGQLTQLQSYSFIQFIYLEKIIYPLLDDTRPRVGEIHIMRVLTVIIVVPSAFHCNLGGVLAWLDVSHLALHIKCLRPPRRVSLKSKTDLYATRQPQCRVVAFGHHENILI